MMFENQIAVITGATAGIGKAMALAFAEQGATVVAVGTNLERGAELELLGKEKTGRDAIFFVAADVSKKADCDAFIEQTLEKHKKIDILINNAGITKDGLFMKMSEEDFDRVMQVNLKSCFYTCQAVVRPMMKARSGRIINVSSVVGLMGNPGQTNYAASKAGMIGFSKSLAKEIATRNITVNCIAPGYTETPMTDYLQGDKRQAVENMIPMSRLGRPEEIAACALFLASPLAGYVTGQTIAVDGGLAM